MQNSRFRGRPRPTGQRRHNGGGRPFNQNNQQPRRQKGQAKYINPDKFVNKAKPAQEVEQFVPKTLALRLPCSAILKLMAM
jgi:hypothetical protein